MEDYALDIIIGKGPSARSIRLKLPRFTVIGATTRLALVSAPLRARFGVVYRLDYYDIAAIQEVVRRAARLLNVKADPGGIEEVALRIAVNDEFSALDTLLRQLPGCLLPGGRAVRRVFRCACCGGCGILPRSKPTGILPVR